MKSCPCCSYSLLRHIRHNHIYWYCTHCRLEMPDFNSIDKFERTLTVGNLEKQLARGMR
jgi:ribosomal protein L37AE/L43A